MRKILAVILALSMLIASCAFAEEAAPAHGKVVVMYTNDVHCAISENIGYAGLMAYKKAYEKAGNEVILADCGDALQGGTVGLLSQGEFPIEIMNNVGYDIAVPGNHDFGYSVERFLELVNKAEFPFICANFRDAEGRDILDTYRIIEAGGWKIGFVGVCTPETYYTERSIYFKNENGEFIYSFLEGDNGNEMYAAVQTAVDAVRAEGADIVIVLSHLGIDAISAPFMSNDLIMNTTGIDVVLDGHSHSVLECEKVKNKNGDEVILTSTGTKFQNVGTLTIGFDEKNNAPTFKAALHSETVFQDDEAAAFVAEINAKLEAETKKVVAHSDVDLVVNDPANGERMVRRAESNLADLCADAYREMLEADICLLNGGGVRDEIKAGDITYGNIINVFPFGNEACVIRATGQNILDALEFGASKLPAEFGGFMQVSGITYEIDASVPSTVTLDEKGAFVEVKGERRVKNVMVGGEPIDTQKEYTVASHNYLLIQCGDGFSMFKDCELLQNGVMTDTQLLIDFITGNLGGVIGEEYADPYGQGRIVFKQ